MHVTKAIDLPMLATELAAAAVVVNGLGTTGALESDDYDVHTYDAEGASIDLPPEAAPVVDAHDASKPQRSKAFEAAEDAERLRIVNERARADPAYAALADLALGKDR